MAELPGIVVTGAAGRMGQMLVRAVTASDACRLVGAIDRPGHDWVGQDVGIAMGGAGAWRAGRGRSAAGVRPRAGGSGLHRPRCHASPLPSWRPRRGRCM